jgi:ankyrin repeat protein
MNRSSDNDDYEIVMEGGDKTWWMRASYMSGIGQWLIDSVEQDDLEDLSELLTKSYPPQDPIDKVRETDIEKAFYYAANGHADACRILYNHLSVTSQDSHRLHTKNFGYFPLHKACKRGHMDVVRVLVRDLKLNVNQYNHEFVTPLVSAIYSPFCIEMSRLLLDVGADPNRSNMVQNHPLLVAVERHNASLVRLLLQYKADPNIAHGARRVRVRNDDSEDDDDDDDDEPQPRLPAHTFVPLFVAVKNGNIEITRLLLKHGADPNLHRAHQNATNGSIQYDRNYDPVVTDLAIKNGDAELLSLLLHRGAQCAQPGNGLVFHRSTALNDLLQDATKSLATKRAICKILVKAATTKHKKNHTAARFVQSSLDSALLSKHGYNLILEAGLNPICAMYRAIFEEHQQVCQLLVEEVGVDPFLGQQDENKNDGRGDPYLCGDVDDDDDDDDDEHAISPFLCAARESEDSPRVFDYFLDLWDKRYSSSSKNGNEDDDTGVVVGKNEHGDYPIHVICCDKHVKLHAVELLLERQAHTLSTVDGEKGLFPFHFAAMWDASVEVIYFLTRHSPDAALRGRRVPSSSSLQNVDATTTDDDKNSTNDASIIINKDHPAASDTTTVHGVSPTTMPPSETSAVPVLGTTTTASCADDKRLLEWPNKQLEEEEDGPLPKKPKVSLE